MDCVKFYWRFVVVFLWCLFLFASKTLAALPGARSTTSSNDVFLGGNYIELGLSKYGSFGTTASKPAGFYGTAVRSNIGMSADADGFDNGSDLRMDYFLPGTPEERWSIGYKISGSSYTAANARAAGTTQISDSVAVDQTVGDNLKATVVATYSSTLETTQVITFSVDDKFFKNTVTLKNLSAGNLDSVRFMRSFDPDNTVDKGGSYVTRNRILYTFQANPADEKAVVIADTSNTDSDPVYVAIASRSPILFYSSDSRARVSCHSSLNPGNVYTAAVYDSAKPKGTIETQDGAISITFDVGTLTPGQSTSLIYYTSLDNRDFSEVEQEIHEDEQESAAVISDIIATPSSTLADISWKTDINAKSQVAYGLVPEYGFLSTESANLVTDHTVNLTNLKACARYFYQVRSKNSSNVTATSSAQTFSTLGCPTSTIKSGSEKTIDTAGGSLSYSGLDSTAALTVPEDFATESASFQINALNSESLPDAPLGTELVADNVFDLIAVTDADEQITSFDTPVTFVVTYGEATESDFIESTLDIYKYSGSEWEKKNCNLDSEANTLTCNLSGFSTYGVFGQPTGSNTLASINLSSDNTNSSTQEVSKPTCEGSKPAGIPNLFQIDNQPGRATLYFTPVSNSTSYYIGYSTKDSAEDYGVEAGLGTEGVQNYTVKDLNPSAIYYFKVRAQNGCTPGDWSNIKQNTVIQPTVYETAFEPEQNLELPPSPTPLPQIKSATTQKKAPTKKLTFKLPPINFNSNNVNNFINKTITERKKLDAFINNNETYLQNSFANLAANLIGTTKRVTDNLAFLPQTFNKTQNEFGNVILTLGEKTQDVSDTIGYKIVELGYVFITESTRIYDVKVSHQTPTSAVISWKTNHPTNAKINYGRNKTFEFELQNQKRLTEHEFLLTNLDPGRDYYFEVMSQYKTYVYDSARQFTTPAE